MKSKAMFFLMFALLFGPVAMANFEFSPIIASLTTTGKSAHSIAQVVNKSSNSIAITLKITERKLNEDGSEDRPDTKDLIVFPNQFLLGPKETKMVKISWLGPEKLIEEKAYRIIVEELPIDFSAKNEARGSVKIMINYVGAIYVNSDPTIAQLNLSKVEISQVDSKKLTLLFQNEGTAHALLKSPKIEITAKSAKDKTTKKIILTKALLENIEGKNVLAKSKLRFNVPMPKELEGFDQFEWSFSYEN